MNLAPKQPAPGASLYAAGRFRVEASEISPLYRALPLNQSFLMAPCGVLVEVTISGFGIVSSQEIWKPCEAGPRVNAARVMHVGSELTLDLSVIRNISLGQCLEPPLFT